MGWESRATWSLPSDLANSVGSFMGWRPALTRPRQMIIIINFNKALAVRPGPRLQGPLPLCATREFASSMENGPKGIDLWQCGLPQQLALVDKRLWEAQGTYPPHPVFTHDRTLFYHRSMGWSQTRCLCFYAELRTIFSKPLSSGLYRRAIL